jgi:response regulator NasT
MSSGGSTHKGTILVVDDDRLVLATVGHGLTQAGYRVIDADNGDDAILLAREHRPDLALLDIRMEGKSGFDVAEYLREVGHTPFIFLSAFSDAATLAQVQKLGALAYMVKPLEVGQIVPAVEAAFARVHSAASPAPLAASEAETVAMAVGVLMHRYSLPRTQARQRLAGMAQASAIALAEQASRVLMAVETLSEARDSV